MAFRDEGPVVVDEEVEAEKAKEALIEAYKREHAGYVRYGRTDRAKAVEAELKALGVTRAQLHSGKERAVGRPTEKRDAE